MAIIDAVVWRPQGSPVIFAHRYEGTNLSTFTQLVVQESQEAVLFSKGKLIGRFGPGKHTLNTENLPLLRVLYGIPFGGVNPFTAEVWYVNKIQTFSIDWDIDSISVHDPDYNTMLPLSACGQYGLKVVDAEKFLVKVVGTNVDYTERDLTRQFTGEFTSKAKSSIVRFMLQNHVGYKQISAYLDQLSAYLCEAMAPFWTDLGLELTRFYVNTIDIDTSTEEGVRVKRALADQSSQSISGHTWQQQQMFDTANKAIGTFGHGGDTSLLGGLMAINMMGGMGGGAAASGMMTPQYNQPTFTPGDRQAPAQSGTQPQQKVRMVYCSQCAKRFPSNADFCPNCGHKYNPCPNCGTDNDEKARRCVSCGAPLVSEQHCPACNAPVTPGATFCPSCGRPLAAVSDTCSRCGAPFAPGAKFCARCGNKR